MDAATIRAMLEQQFEHAGSDPELSHAMYREDAVLDCLQRRYVTAGTARYCTTDSFVSERLVVCYTRRASRAGPSTSRTTRVFLVAAHRERRHEIYIGNYFTDSTRCVRPEMGAQTVSGTACGGDSTARSTFRRIRGSSRSSPDGTLLWTHSSRLSYGLGPHPQWATTAPSTSPARPRPTARGQSRRYIGLVASEESRAMSPARPRLAGTA